MSKHKVKRYDGEEESMVEADPMEAANKGESLDTEAGPKAMTMPRRPVSRTPVASKPVAKASTASTDDRSKRPSLRGTTDTESRDRFGIPTGMGSAGKSYAPTGKAAESASGSEAMRNIEAAGNAFGASGAIQGVRRGVAAAKGLGEFAASRAGRAGAKEAPDVVSSARGALDRAMSAERASPKTGDMAKINDALKAFKNGPRPVSKPTASQSAFAKGPKGPMGRRTEAERDKILRADTLKTGGKVKGYASGGSVSSRADGIAQRGRTRGKMC